MQPNAETSFCHLDIFLKLTGALLPVYISWQNGQIF
jgi:hypothetical protein